MTQYFYITFAGTHAFSKHVVGIKADRLDRALKGAHKTFSEFFTIYSWKDLNGGFRGIEKTCQLKILCCLSVATAAPGFACNEENYPIEVSWMNIQDFEKEADGEGELPMVGVLEENNLVVDKEIELTDKDVYFITSAATLDQEGYDRLRKQIDESWPKDKRRPILLENCSVVKL